jgi:hypothetical protein
MRIDADGRGVPWKDLRRTYQLPDHPGGLTYNGSPTPLLDYSARTVPPISHIIRFWTSSASLFISPEPVDQPVGHTGTDVLLGARHYEVSIPSIEERIFTVYLEKQWRDTSGDIGEFIVVSPGDENSFPVDEELSDDDYEEQNKSVFLNVMLIEWSGGVASRVQMVESPIETRQWRRAGPIWKLISLA